MRRPLLSVALCFIGGVLLAEYARISPAGLWAALAGLALCSLLALTLPCSECVANLSVLLFVVAVGMAREGATHCPPAADDIRLLASDRPLVTKLRGVIDSPPEIGFRQPLLADPPEASRLEPFTDFVLRVNAVYMREGWRAAGGRVRTRIFEEAPRLRYGDAIEMCGTIRRPLPPTNPGQFDYKTFLARQGIHVLARANYAVNVRLLSHGHGSPIKRAVFAVRRAADRFLARHASPRIRSILLCMLFGNRNAIPDDVEEAFVRTGVVHVLAISGLHLMILAGSLWWLLCLTRLDRRANAAVVLAFVVFYAVMTGMRVSVLRAGIIVGLICLAEMLERDQDTINSLAGAALLILAANPNQLFSSGFQLSFAAVLGIVCFEAPIRRLLFGLPSLAERLAAPEHRSLAHDLLRRYVRLNISASAAALLATAPLVAYTFHIVTPFAVVLNIFVFPLVWAIVGLGSLVVPLGILLGQIVWPLAVVLNGLAMLLDRFVQSAGALRFTYAYIAGPSLLWLAAYYAVLILAADRRALGLRRVHLLVLLGMLFIVPAGRRAIATPEDTLVITCLDVGHGAAFVIEFPNGRNLVYDAGTWGRFDVGKRVIAPFLWSRGIRRVNTLVLSHAHVDHYSGVPGLREHIGVDRVLLHRRFVHLPITERLVEDLRHAGADVVEISTGARLSGYGECAVTVLHPPEGPMLERLSPNDRSCVLLLEWRGSSLLLTGDLQDMGARVLRRSFPGLRADIAQVPHHGRLSSALVRFLDTVSPGIGLVNAGRRGLGQGPDLSGLDRIRLYATPRCGAITVTVRPGGEKDVDTFLPTVLDTP